MKSIWSKIEIHPLFYFFALFSVMTAHFREFYTFMLIIVIHECGHLIFALLFHWKIESILLLPFGGMIKFNEKLNRPIYQELLILVGGPLFQILFYKIYPTIYHYPLLIFNLLPIYPLDGAKFLFLFCNFLMSYYKCYWVLFFSSYLTVILVLIQNPSLYIVILGSYLLFQNIRLIHDLPDIFLIFLFERYHKSYPYYKKKIIKGRKYKKMQRSVRHIFFYHHNFYSEEEALKKYFEGNKKLLKK